MGDVATSIFGPRRDGVLPFYLFEQGACLLTRASHLSWLADVVPGFRLWPDHGRNLKTV